jgi:DnaJ-class molecular chaperone
MEITQDSNTERDGIRCAALVGASSVESEMCPNCGGQGWYMNGPTEDPYQQECDLCYGTGSVERIAPTVSSQLPRPEPRYAQIEDAQTNLNPD